MITSGAKYCTIYLFNKNTITLREAAKKFFFSGPATKKGGGLRAWPLRKITFFEAGEEKKFPKNVAAQLEGRGGRP